jgi:hypothetical protein
MQARRTQITVEQDLVAIVRRTSVERFWCPGCGDEVDVVSVNGNTLAEILGQGIAHVWIETGQLHVMQSPAGTARICLASLLRCFEPQPVQAINIAKETL